MIQSEIREIITSIAERLRSPLLVEDDRQRVVAYSPQYDNVDELRREAILTGSLRREIIDWCNSFGIRTAQGPVRTPHDEERGFLGRVCVPIRYAGILVGFIWAIDDDERLDGPSLDMLVEAAAAIGLLMYRARVAQQLGSELLRALVSTSSRLRTSAAQDPAIRDALPAGMHAVIVVIRGGADQAEIEAAIRHRSPRTFEFRTGTEIVVMVPVRAGEALTARAWCDAVIKKDRAGTCAIGVSDPYPSLMSLHLAYRQAADAAWIVDSFLGIGRIGEWSRLGAYRLLARATADGDAADVIDRRLAPVLADPELALTLETYLDLGCRPRETAEAIHIHRGTLYYRLAKIERLTGADLRNGGDRLSLHMGVKLSHLQGARIALADVSPDPQLEFPVGDPVDDAPSTDR